jgi:hypothetical protein
LKGFFDVPFRALFVYAGNSTVFFFSLHNPRFCWAPAVLSGTEARVSFG